MAYLWDQYRAEKSGKRIVENMTFSGKPVLAEFGPLSPEEITTKRCRAYVAKRKKLGRAPGTIWSELNHLQIVINWSAKQNLIPRAVVVEKPTKPDPRNRRLTRDEGRRLLAAAGIPHVRLAIALMLGTAARIGAILELTWDRVDLDRGLVHYANPEATARRKGRASVPLAPDLLARLREAHRGALSDYVVEYAGEPIKSVKRSFARAVERAGLEDVTPHVLRHTAATWMAEAGIPMTKIAAVLGHSDSRITERVYAKFTPAHLRDAVAALDMSEVPTGSVNLPTVNEGETDA